MKEMSLVEPHHLSGARMRGDGLANLTRAQFTTPPFVFDSHAPAVRLYLVWITGLEDVLPREIQSSAVVAHVHHSLFHESFFDLGRNPLEDNATIGNRCFTA